MKLIIAGGRDTKNAYGLVTVAIQDYLYNRTLTDLEIVHGNSGNIDMAGKKYGIDNGLKVTPFPADWKRHGRAAGPIRNREMAEYADELIAVWDGVSRGTKNMIEEMEILDKPVHMYRIGEDFMAKRNQKETTKQTAKDELTSEEQLSQIAFGVQPIGGRRLVPMHDIEVDEYLLECVTIEPTMLDEEFTRVAVDIAYWNEKYNNAIRAYLMAKYTYDQAYARVLLLVREEVAASGAKKTVDDIKAMVSVHPEVSAAYLEQLETEAEQKALRNRCEAVHAKREMLQSLGAKLRTEMMSDPVLRDQIIANQLNK